MVTKNFKQGSLWKFTHEGNSIYYFITKAEGIKLDCIVAAPTGEGTLFFITSLVSTIDKEPFEHCSLEEYEEWVPQIHSHVDKQYQDLIEKVEQWAPIRQVTGYWNAKLNKKTTEYEEADSRQSTHYQEQPEAG